MALEAYPRLVIPWVHQHQALAVGLLDTLLSQELAIRAVGLLEVLLSWELVHLAVDLSEVRLSLESVRLAVGLLDTLQTGARSTRGDCADGAGAAAR